MMMKNQYFADHIMPVFDGGRGQKNGRNEMAGLVSDSNNTTGKNFGMRELNFKVSKGTKESTNTYRDTSKHVKNLDGNVGIFASNSASTLD